MRSSYIRDWGTRPEWLRKIESKARQEVSRTVDVKWDVLLDDDDWAEDENGRGAAEDLVQPSHASRRSRLVVLFFLLLAAGLWLWVGGPFAPTQAEAGVAAALADEARIPAGTILAGASSAPAIQSVDFRENGVLPAVQVRIEQSRFLGQQAMVEVRVVDAVFPLSWREVRFYEQSATGWQRIPPVPAFWGDEQRLDSEYFTFRYRRGDGLAVQQAAATLDSHYSDLRRAFGLPAPSTVDRIRVEVEIGHGFSDRSQRRMQIRSPRLLSIPDGLTDGDVLVQYALFILTEWTITEAQERQSDNGTWQMSGSLRSGLRLWSYEQNGAPLARWQRALTETVLATNEESDEALTALCQRLSVWGSETPGAGPGIPCERMGSGLGKVDWQAAHLDQLPAPFVDYAGESPYVQIELPGSSLLLASLLDYATETYGRGRIPVLLGTPVGAGSWQTLIPAVFDVSAEEFEAGWQEWLAEEYGLRH